MYRISPYFLVYISKLSLSVRRTKERVKRDKTFLFEFENGHVMVEKPEGPQTNKSANSPQPKKIGNGLKMYSVV